MTTHRIGVDIGGTFTDVVVRGEDGSTLTRKVSSSVGDYARAITETLDAIFREEGIAPATVAEVRHGTTVASNAILEQRGARTGLIGTEGFRDVLEIRNLRMPRLYDLAWEKPPPLVARRLRLTVRERVSVRGEVRTPLDPAQAEAVVDRLLGEGVEAIAICLLNAFANPVHERMIRDLVRRKAPDLPCSVSHEVLPLIKEYERTSTTVINAYVTPVVSRYLEALERDLERAGVTAPLLLMQSNGGLTGVAEARRLPMNIIESGPAGGVIGAQALARLTGIDDVITFDMGGTTAKASAIEGGRVARAPEYQVGGGILQGSRLLTGSGYLLRVPSIDLAEVGAGGGSIVWIDAGGSLQVGPRSAGAVPGPLCYATGGTEPTITDANLILGYLNPRHLVGGALPLDAERAHRIFAERVAEPLGLGLEHAAYGAHRIVAANMIRAIKAVSTERGRDPRGYALFAFGGNGPVFAAGMAAELSMRRVVIPPSPGVFSSFGLLHADVEHHLSRTFRERLREIDVASLDAAWAELAAQARARLASEGFDEAHAELRREASLHYQGQSFELTVPAPAGPVDAAALAALEEAFGAEHERTYGHRAGPEEPVELVDIHLVARGLPERPRGPEPVPPPPAARPEPPRRAYFGPRTGWLETPVLARADLAAPREGPCIVEEYDATCVVPPGARATLDDLGNLIVEV